MYTVCPSNETDFFVECPANRLAKQGMVLTAGVISIASVVAILLSLSVFCFMCQKFN